MVERSELIQTLAEAREYYRAKLGGVRKVTCHGHKVRLFFPVDVVHIYSSAEATGEIVTQQRRGVGRFEVRRFDLRRARLIDEVLPAVSLFTVSTVAQDGCKLLHGRRLESGDYQRVALRKGRDDSWVCVSAYPVDARAYLQAWNSARAKFPPK